MGDHGSSTEKPISQENGDWPVNKEGDRSGARSELPIDRLCPSSKAAPAVRTTDSSVDRTPKTTSWNQKWHMLWTKCPVKYSQGESNPCFRDENPVS